MSPTSRSDDPFVRGVLVGVAATTVLAQIWLAIELAPMRDMYREYGAPLPTLTTIAVSPYWLWGVPTIGAIAVAALATRRPARLLVYALVAAALLLLAIATWRWAQAPLRALSEPIR